MREKTEKLYLSLSTTQLLFIHVTLTFQQKVRRIILQGAFSIKPRYVYKRKYNKDGSIKSTRLVWLLLATVKCLVWMFLILLLRLSKGSLFDSYLRWRWLITCMSISWMCPVHFAMQRLMAMCICKLLLISHCQRVIVFDWRNRSMDCGVRRGLGGNT